MSTSWMESLRRRADRIVRPGGRAVILLYHRVAEDRSDPYGLCVTPAHFAEHLEAVRAVGQPFPLHALARAVIAGTVPDGAVCITFDDGYVDNLRVAKPLLESNDTPATVFMTTGRAGRDREFWWEELQRAFFEPVELPAELELTIGGERRVWRFGTDATYAGDDPRRVAAWHLLDEDTPSLRHAAFREAYASIKPLPQAERTRVLDALLAWAGISRQTVRESRRALEPAEVVELASGGLVEIGAHTVNHPALPSQPADVQREEIARSKADVEAWLGTEVPGFAYPYGLYDDTAVAAARSARFTYACSCDGGPARRGSDPHILPRVEVMDCDGDRLAELLSRELDGRRSRPGRGGAR